MKLVKLPVRIMKPVPALIPPPADPDADLRRAHREGVWLGLVLGSILGAGAMLFLLDLLRIQGRP
jgi:hypothetical protein